MFIDWSKYIKWFLGFQFGILILPFILEGITGYSFVGYFFDVIMFFWFLISFIFGIISFIIIILQRKYFSKKN